MNKTVRIGTLPSPDSNPAPMNVYAKIEITNKDGKGQALSISGVEGPTNDGNARGSCGQIVMDLDPADITPAPGWTLELIREFLAVWDRWHLNDMRANCDHQTGEEWDTSKQLGLQEYTWGDKYHGRRRAIENGSATVEEYTEYQAISPRVLAVTIGIKRPKYETPEIAELLAAGWVKPGKQETKTAGWVNPEEHPDGLLGKPCPVCGYKYGYAWNYEPLPAGVVDFLKSLPATDRRPAWI